MKWTLPLNPLRRNPTMLDHPKQFDDRFIARPKKSSIALSIFTMLIGALVLTGWLFDFHELTTIYGAMAVRANTALALLLSGASLWLLNSDQERREFRIAGVIGAAIVSIIGLLTLSEHIFGWNLTISRRPHRRHRVDRLCQSGGTNPS